MSEEFIAQFINSEIQTNGGNAEPMDVTIGKKANTASVTATSSLFSWVKQIYTSVTTAITNIATVNNTVNAINTNSAKRLRTIISTISQPVGNSATTILDITGAGVLDSLAYKVVETIPLNTNIQTSVYTDGILLFSSTSNGGSTNNPDIGIIRVAQSATPFIGLGIGSALSVYQEPFIHIHYTTSLKIVIKIIGTTGFKNSNIYIQERRYV